jgi:hypothetical protein
MIRPASHTPEYNKIENLRAPTKSTQPKDSPINKSVKTDIDPSEIEQGRREEDQKDQNILWQNVKKMLGIKTPYKIKISSAVSESTLPKAWKDEIAGAFADAGGIQEIKLLSFKHGSTKSKDPEKSYQFRVELKVTFEKKINKADMNLVGADTANRNNYSDTYVDSFFSQAVRTARTKLKY